MSKPIVVAGLIASSLCCAAMAPGQEATEIFIPLGSSPGVSNKSAVMGPIDSVDEKSRSLRVTTPSGARTIEITERTRIWRDRSPLKLSNQTGTWADLQKGRKVEVKLEPGEGKRTAEWVKVQITEAAPAEK
jgi:hypothetical protein